MDDRGSFEPDRHRSHPAAVPPDASVGQRAWLLHRGAEYTFFDMVRRRRARGLNGPFLVGLLMVQMMLIALLVYWLL